MVSMIISGSGFRSLQGADLTLVRLFMMNEMQEEKNNICLSSKGMLLSALLVTICISCIPRGNRRIFSLMEAIDEWPVACKQAVLVSLIISYRIVREVWES